MKLISCYIDNYGTLANKTLTFESGFNSIIQPNGAGKSTLASFIKAMFYGLKATTKRSVNENERKKYLPWQGGNYGGNLVFEAGGKRYRVERYFGAKEATDTFALIDEKTGKPSHDYSSNLGEELFGLDSASYERCTFVPQKELEKGITDSISKKLTNATLGTDSKDSLESALALLEKRKAQIKNRQNSGVLADVEAQLAALKEREKEIMGKAPMIDQLEAENGSIGQQVDELDEKLAKVKDKIKDYSKVKEAEAKRQASLRLKEEYAASLAANEAKRSEHLALLNGHSLTAQELEKQRGLSAEILKLEQKKEILNASSQAEELEQLKQYFKGNVPTASDIENAKSQLLALQNTSKTANPAANKRQGLAFWLFAAAALLLLAGTIALVFTYPVFAAVTGAGLLVAAAICLFIKYKKPKVEVQETQPRIELLSRLEPDNPDLEDALDKIRTNLRDYERLCEKQQRTEKEVEELSQELIDKKAQFNAFLGQFDFESGLLAEQCLAKLDATLAALPELEKTIAQQKKQLADLEKEASVGESAKPAEDIYQLQRQEAEYQAQIDELKAQKTHNAASIKMLSDEWDELDQLRQDAQALDEQRIELENELKIIKKTKDFLQNASDELSSKYLAPLKTSLDKYLQRVLSNDELRLKLDTDLNISVDAGKTYDLEYLSRGYQTVVDLCIRFALVDVLFEADKPFIILDDPFVHLDEQKLASALSVVRELAKEKQIIYLTCHKARV